jgi:hypothetical protein
MALYRFFTSSGGGLTEIDITLNENVSQGDVLRAKVAGAHGVAEKASSNGSSVFGIAKETGTIGNSIKMAQIGAVQVNFVDSLSSSDIGKPVYLSSTLGQATITVPTAGNVIRLGDLQATDGTIILNPNSIVNLQ